MNASNFLKAGVLTLIIVVSCFTGWELYLRNKGYNITYDDGEPFWADKRARVYGPSDKTTVFIGSSRIKFDLDIPTWENITGTYASQLAMEGNSPREVLTDLANDINFNGNLVVDVTEGLFFSTTPGYGNQAAKNISYYQKRTPTQRASFQINHLLESKLVFLDKNYFTLNSYLNNVPIKNRPGVYGLPDFPWEFNNRTFERQSYMHSRFLSDTNLQNKVKSIWQYVGRAMRTPPPAGGTLDSIWASVKADVDKIKSRGGKIIFVRTPSSGPFLAGEAKGFPREQYWDKLLAVTSCPGIHFSDYETTAHFECPEFSHLSPGDAIIYTKSLIKTLEEKGWTFPYKQTTL